MSEQVQRQKTKYNPTNQIDLQVMTTEPFISSDYMSDRVRNKFRVFGYVRDEKGRYVLNENGERKTVVVKDIWSAIEVFTQDLRLGYYTGTELKYVRYNLDLCIDIITVFPDFKVPAFLLLTRSTNITETGQGRGGFLRNLFNTFFHNQNIQEEKPKERNFFGLGKKNKGGM